MIFLFLKHQNHLSCIIHSVAFPPSEGKCLGKCECVSIFFLVNSFHMINCRELYWNPLKLKSQPTWSLGAKVLNIISPQTFSLENFRNICSRWLPFLGIDRPVYTLFNTPGLGWSIWVVWKDCRTSQYYGKHLIFFFEDKVIHKVAL